jgi:urease accessory protein
MRWIVLCVAFAGGLISPAFAHPGHGSPESFAAGVAHPLTGLDHVTAMVAVGLWAGIIGGRALWTWPAISVGMMLIGGALGMAHVTLPFVDSGILASVVVLGLLVVFAVDLPVAAGAAVVGAVALLHGHAHGSEVAETLTGLAYMAGLALATITLHGLGIVFAFSARRVLWGSSVRVAGGACVALGVGLLFGVL